MTEEEALTAQEWTKGECAMELLPCPFCGSPAETEKLFGGYYGEPGRFDRPPIWRVACESEECGASVQADLPEAADLAWNHRAPRIIIANHA